ncbi:hypothetical protein MMC30_009090 [Trapelia coarctata]|nr:hypothetical protein [Trapelia coarctata]
MATTTTFLAKATAPFKLRPVDITEFDNTEGPPPSRLPILTPLLFPNISSDARDHCANERTFLSWLRLSIYMSVVSIAIIISFHLKNQPTAIEKKIAMPVGLCFWVLSLACLMSGAANYVGTVRKYRERRALVQSGWKTQVVFTVVATAIVAACVLLLTTNAQSQ